MVQVQELQTEAGTTAVVSATDLRRSLGTVLDEILPHYGEVQIERKGEYVATLSAPKDDAGVRTRTFGEDSAE